MKNVDFNITQVKNSGNLTAYEKQLTGNQGDTFQVVGGNFKSILPCFIF